MTPKALYNKVVALDTSTIAIESVAETVEEIRNYNLLQLLDGKTNTGADITPTYFSDPFFKTPQAALLYSKWKDEISPPSNRRSGVPNLFINGYYHSTRKVRVEGDKIVYGSSDNKLGAEIDVKYKNIDGLSPQSRSVYIPKVLRPRFNMKMQAALGLTFRK
jgi:hypothetical protein